MKKENYGTMLVLAFLVFAVAIIYGIYYVNMLKPSTDVYFSKYNVALKNELKEQLDLQSNIDDKINDIVNNGNYTMEDPCVLVNPYKISPLSALIIFNTDYETSISVSLNDEVITTVKETKKHVIPIYGLYANAVNIIKLSSLREVKEVRITTEVLNNNIDDFSVKTRLDGHTHLFMLGALNKKDSLLRGFDHNNNLIFYLKFGNIIKADFFSESMQIAYNASYKTSNDKQYIKLELDYLGRIKAIHKSSTDLINNETDINGNIYAIKPVDIYNKTINNYEIKTLSDTSSSTPRLALKSSEINNKLIDAKTYSREYTLTFNGPFITYDFQNKDVTLILTSKNSDLSFSYDLSNDGIIRTDLKGEYSLYIITNGTYYTLLSTVIF